MRNNLKVVSFKRTPAYVHHRAMLNRRDNNIVDALELMRRAVEQSPDNREYRLDLAELYCEMGCHAQSTRLLLDMLAEENGPSECYYGLALNQLAMNDLTGARRFLWLYRRSDPSGEHSEAVEQLTAELDFFEQIDRYSSRKSLRAGDIANRACDAMKGDQPEKACRLFERSLEVQPEQYDMRALYAMALLICGRRDDAQAQAQRAAEGFPPSVRSLCVSAQVYALLGDGQTARQLVRRAVEERPEGQDLRLMLYAMGEMGMDDLVAEHVRRALHETPFDRDLLHMQAVALKRLGTPDADVVRFWARILRIDPEDTVAQFYQAAALNGELSGCELDYGYQVPAQEYVRRLKALVTELGRGYERVEARWRDDAAFRQLVRWAADADDVRLNRVAMTALAIIDHRESRSLLRSLLISPAVSEGLKVHAALALHLQGIAMDAVLPPGSGDGFLMNTQAMLKRLGVGERQLVRYADEVLQREYDVSALPQLLLIWTAYRQLRNTKADPLRCVGGGAAALAYNYLLIYGPKPGIDELAKAFGCDARQLVYYARRIAGRLERIGDDTHEDT